MEVSHPTTSRVKPHEYRVRFARPLRSARFVSPGTEPTPPQPAPPKPVPTHAPALVVATPEVQPAVDFTATEVARELQADRERIEDVLGNVRAAVESLRTEQNARVGELQRLAFELALTIASRLLHQRVEAGEFPVEAKVRDMIAQLGSDEPVIVRLNPADLALLNSRLGGKPLTADRANPRFVADPNLGRGDCHVDGRESALASDMARELEDIRDELYRSLKNVARS